MFYKDDGYPLLSRLTFTALVLILALACVGGCTIRSEVGDAMPILQETAALTPVNTSEFSQLLEPIATAARVFPHSWSPDSETLAFWTFTEEEVAADFTLPPGTLSFYQTRTGETCQSSVNVSYGYGSQVISWLSEGRIEVLNDQGQILHGTPCQDDFVVADGGETTIEGKALSPDDRFYVSTVETEPQKFITSIFDAATKEVLHTTAWESAGGLGGIGLGGQWVADDIFLIWTTVEEPLLFMADGEVVPVVSQLFDQSIATICPTTPCETYFATAGAMVEGTDSYHLVLYTQGIEADFPPVRLYHSESGEVEELDFTQQGGFSPDGRTLLLYTSLPAESQSLWIRLVDPPGSETRLLLTTDMNPFPISWSPDSTKLVTTSSGNITIFSIPDGTIYKTWDTDGVQTFAGNWSPDSRYLAVQGILTPGQEEALFVIQARE